MSATFEQYREGPVALLLNNNPQSRNALSREYYEGACQALAEVGSDPQVGAVVLAGANSYFCSGGDLNQLITRQQTPESQRRADIEKLHQLIRAIRSCPKPVIAAVDGGAAGAGVSLALACDMVVMAEDAYLSVAYVKVGLTPDGGVTAFLAELLPRQLLTELVMTGDRIGATRLATLGLVNELSKPAGAQQDAIALAQRLSRGPERALARIKQLAHSAYARSVDEQLNEEARCMAVSLGEAEAAEGIKAFFDKRAPDYQRNQER